MSGADCYIDASGCVVCPEVEAEPAASPIAIVDPLLGWNAGANSIAVLDGDVRVTDALEAIPVGIVVGFKGHRNGVTAPELIDHGLYFYGLDGRCYIEVMESGRRVGAPAEYTLGSLFEIRREAGKVSYWINQAKWLDSQKRSTGPVLVNACLFSGGDTLP